MNKVRLRMLGVSAGLLTLATTLSAFGQTTAEGEAGGEAQVGMGLPGASAATTTTTTTTTAVAATGSDHDQMVGRLAVGYLGRSGLNVGGTPLSAPVIGVRYWLDRGMGLDLGLGMAYQGGSQEDAGVETDDPSLWAFILHGGVPLALATGRHYVFEVIPEANIGFGTGSLDETDFGGFLLDIGARAGAEVHFGFIGLPEISLQGSVGLLFQIQNSSTSVEGGDEESESNVSFRTTVYDSPWNIFTGNVAAFYYF